MFHPDEPLVAVWIDQTRDEGRIVDRVYPSGWFELFRIRLWWERKSEEIAADWKRHSVQNGGVSAVHERSYAWRPPPPKPDPPYHSVQDGRDFNAWLYAISAVLVCLAAMEAGMRPAVALVSALFFLASPGPAEFCRYCETDAGLVVSLALFAWCAAAALRRRSFAWTAVASFAAGFAISCKYSLAPLALWPPILAAVVAIGGAGAEPSRGGRRAALRTVALAAGGLALAAAGFLFGTPALRMDPDWWMTSCHDVSAGTYSEILANLGGKPSRIGAMVVRASNLVRHLAVIGAPTLLWGAFSWSFWLRPAFRRQLAGVPLLLPAFLPFAVLFLPFVRSQETLPVAIVLALGAGLPLEWWLRRRESGAPPPSRRFLACACAAALLGAIALGDGALRTSGMISCFRLRDTRVEAQNWLLASVPAGTPVAFDGYVSQAARGVPCAVSGQPGGLQWRWTGVPERAGPGGPPPRYYVENVGFSWRFPVLDLRTGRLKKEVRDRLAAWEADTFPVREWSVPRDVPRPTFGQPSVRLVSFDVPAPGAPDAPVILPRPLALLPPEAPLYDASGPAGLGAIRAFLLVGKRTTMRLARDGAPRWLVARSLEGATPANVVAERFFRPRKATLPPGGAVALHAPPPPSLASRAVAWPASKARLRGDDQGNFVAAFLTPSAAEAARTLRTAGNPAGALALLREAGAPDAASRVEAFLAARAAGEAAAPEWEAAAREAIAACEAAAEAAECAEAPTDAETEAARRAATICGVPVGPAVDFARLRLVRQAIVPGVRLPVFLPEGRYAVALSPRRPDAKLPVSLPGRIFAGQTGEFRKEKSPDGSRRLVADIVVPAPGAFLSPVAAPAAFEPFFAEAEISWSVAARLRRAASEIRAALASSPSP